MSPEIVWAVGLLAAMILFLILGLEIAWSVGTVALIGLIFYVDQPISQLALSSWGSLNSFTLTALPLFVFMGSVLGNSGINERLFSAIDKWVGGLPGGLACSVIAGNAVFGAMSGSTIAATATFGKTAFPVMDSKGYAPALSLGSIAAGTVLAPLIPPSILLIIYGVWQNLSLVDLLAAGLIPGLTLTILYIISIMVRVKLDPSLSPPSVKSTWREKMYAARDVLPFAVMIFMVLGAIFGGFMTPVEAAGLGGALSIILTFLYKRLTLEIFMRSLKETVRVTSFSMFIMAMATLLSHVYNTAGIIPLIRDVVTDLPVGKYGIIAMFCLMYFILGCFFDSWSMLFLTFPFVMPVITALGINPILWGVFYVMVGEQSTITPPFGLTLYVLHGIVPQYSMGMVVRGALPFLIPIYINALMLLFFPQIALWLPSVLR